jgi:signal recognition particle subunit SRP54
MFDQLGDRLQATLSEVRSRGKLSEDDVDRAMREIRLALLEADVNFKVVKAFTSTVKERALGAEVMESLDPGQQLTKIVNEELAEVMGGASRDIAMASSGTTVILMAGLQGSGKTTACAKLALHLAEGGKDVALAACDVYRPAAVDQLVTVGERAGAHVYQQGTDRDPVDIAEWAVGQAKADDRDALIIDTAGRLHIDDDLMEELAKIRKRTKPHDVLLVVDAMTGQDAVGVAEAFSEAAEFDGVVMTKLDGDARGGAALSIKAVTGKPILYASTGEKLEDFERFHPDRMAGRILGMGDVLSLIEKAEKEVDADQAVDMQEKMRRQQFTLEDFLQQMRQVRRMGPMGNLLGMLPGMGAMKGMKDVDVDEGDHPLHDSRGAPPSGDDQGLAPQADRRRRRGQGAARQPAREAVREHAQADEADGVGQDARPAAADEGHALGVFAAALRRGTGMSGGEAAAIVGPVPCLADVSAD